MEHQKRIIVLKNSRNSWMKRHSGKHVRYCFKVALMKEKKNQVRSRTSNYCVSQNKSRNESLVIYPKNNSKKHNNISVEKILSLCFWDSGLLENTIFLAEWWYKLQYNFRSKKTNKKQFKILETKYLKPLSELPMI